MTPETFSELEGNEMNDREIDAFLRQQGVGVLSLTDGAEGYGVPISFGYDGKGAIYFVFLGLGERSKKERFAERTGRANLTVLEVSSKHVWTSVIASGTLHRIAADEEWEALVEAIADNAWYPSLFSEADPMHGIQGWRLQIDELTGKRSRG